MAIRINFVTQFDNRGIKKAQRELAQIGQSISRGLDVAVIGGLAAATTGLVSAVKAASNYAAEFEGVNQVFKDAAGSVKAFSATAAETAGLSATEALRASKTFGLFATSAGLSGTAAADFATTMVQLAGDLGSFNDVPTADALAAIQSGLQGQAEPLRKFGVFLTDDALKAEYLAKTGQKVTGSLSAQQKMMAAYSLILKQTTIQQGDYVKYGDTLGNQVKTITEEFANLQAEIGTQLIPVLEDMLPAVRDLIPVLGEKMKAAVASVDWKGLFTVLIDGLTFLIENAENIAKFVAGLWAMTKAFAAVKLILDVVTVSVGVFNGTLAVSPIGLAIIALGTLVWWFNGVANSAGAAAKAQEKFNARTLETIKNSKALVKVGSILNGKNMTVSGLPKVFNTDSQNAINKAVSGFAKSAKKTKDIWASMGATPSGGTKKSKKDAAAAKKLAEEKAAAKAAADAAAALAEQIKQLKDEFRKAIQGSFKDLLAKEIPAMGKFEQKVYDTFTSIKDTILNADSLIMSKKKKATFLGLAEFAQQQLSKIAKQRDELAAKIENAKSFMDSVKDAIFGQVNITDMGRSAKAIIMNFQKVIKSSLDFNKNIKALQAAGLGQDAIKQIIEAGAQVGGQTAQALLRGGPEAITEVNSLFGQLTDVAGQVSETAGSVMFGSGVDLTNGLISGLLSQEEQLKLAADQLATAFQTQFNKRLGLGKADTGFINVGGTTKSGTVINLTVNAPMGTGNNIGKQIIDEISRFEKTSGMVFARA